MMENMAKPSNVGEKHRIKFIATKNMQLQHNGNDKHAFEF